MFQCAANRYPGSKRQVVTETLTGQAQSIDEHVAALLQIPVHESNTEVLLDAVADLPPFLRSLVVADGTVTLLLTAYFAEDIRVDTREQSRFILVSDLPHLQLDAGEEAFYRQVDLTGSRTGRTYAQATSVLNPAALPETLFRALIREDVGMGEVLRNAARGSYREVLGVRRDGPSEVSRTYAVILNGRPAILITETFRSAFF